MTSSTGRVTGCQVHSDELDRNAARFDAVCLAGRARQSEVRTCVQEIPRRSLYRPGEIPGAPLSLAGIALRANRGGRPPEVLLESGAWPARSLRGHRPLPTPGPRTRAEPVSSSPGA